MTRFFQIDPRPQRQHRYSIPASIMARLRMRGVSRRPSNRFSTRMALASRRLWLIPVVLRDLTQWEVSRLQSLILTLIRSLFPFVMTNPRERITWVMLVACWTSRVRLSRVTGFATQVVADKRFCRTSTLGARGFHTARQGEFDPHVRHHAQVVEWQSQQVEGLPTLAVMRVQVPL